MLKIGHRKADGEGEVVEDEGWLSENVPGDEQDRRRLQTNLAPRSLWSLGQKLEIGSLTGGG